MQKPNFTLLALVILFVFMPVSLQSQEKTEIGKFRDAACPFPLPDGVVPGENFKFGYVSVPELHSDPEGKIIELAVAIFPSTSEIHQPDPLVMNTSGPGKSNMDNFIPDIAGGLGAYLLPQRDVVIIELRGLRYSRPFLSLEEVREARLAMMDKNLGKEETMDILRKAMQASLKRFEAAGVNLSAYNNVETAADIALVMEHLGYEKFNIVGSSAGTMVAHHVIRDYPERIRCGVMDAGLPLNQDIMINYVPNLVNSLKNYFEECRNDPDCHAAFPDLESRFLSLLASLN
jgi:pimeloyl-ACP methyl ester carboxylesterase